MTRYGSTWGRKTGISTLLACQNEEVTVEWSIRSFLDFSDEIIIVDNGSTDGSKDICRGMAHRYPDKVQFYEVDELKDLYENRQYALERSRFRWIVRADADYVCYTDGDCDCKELREFLLKGRSWTRPAIVHLMQASVHGDFWHTGRTEGALPCKGGSRIGGTPFPPISRSMPRIYSWFPGFRFARLGRWEGVPLNALVRRIVQNVHWPKPVWMHCNVKSDENFFYRSERTNWRELGDYVSFPTLESYLQSLVCRKYGTDDMALAQRIYVEENVLPYLEPYDPTRFYPYPSLVLDAMQKNPLYRITREEGRVMRIRVSNQVPDCV